MERALDWMDEAIYLDKKVLVHCRMGHGRTGTFIAAYLLRRGFDFKAAERTMKGRKAVPATYDQRRFLKKYGKQVGPLQHRGAAHRQPPGHGRGHGDHRLPRPARPFRRGLACRRGGLRPGRPSLLRPSL